MASDAKTTENMIKSNEKLQKILRERFGISIKYCMAKKEYKNDII
jgi:hypothetical protein